MHLPKPAAKHFSKLHIAGLLLLMPVLLFSGCGHVKSAKKLIRQARADHGKCEVVSKSESEESVKVVLKDELQGFTYTVISSMSNLSIDGSSFGSYPQTRDKFTEALIEYVLLQAQGELSPLLEKYDATLDNNLDLWLTKDADEKEAGKLAEEVSSILQKQNLQNRMDGFEIAVNTNKKHFGSCVLPDCKFRDPETEKDAFFLQKACETIESTGQKRSAVTFVRKEEKTLADTGLPLSEVYESYSSEPPSKPTDPVTFYYFKTDNQEFYILDITSASTYNWVTNFDRSLEKKKKDGWFHIHFRIH